MSTIAIIGIVVVSLIVLLFVGLRVLMALSVAKIKGKSAPLVHKQSGKRIKSGKKTMLYFHTPQCGACRMQAPVIKNVKKDHPDAIFEIDASVDRNAASAYGVMGVPFSVFIDGGKVIKAKVGVQSEADITSFFG